MEHSLIQAAAIACPIVTIERETLLPALDLIARKIVERRNTLPILSHVMLEATETGQLRLSATDLDVQATFTLPVQWEVPGAFTVCAATLRDVVKKAAKGAPIMLRFDDGLLEVATGRIRQRLQTLSADDFPVMAIGEIAAAFELPAGLIDDLAMVAPFAEKAGHKYYLQGVAMAVAGDALNFVATDGRIMSRVAYPLPDGLDQSESAIIPNKAIAVLRALGKTAGGAAPTVGITARNISFDCGDVVLTSKLIDGTFPSNWAAFVTPTGEVSGLMLPELDARFPSGGVEMLTKAAPAPLQWETGAINDQTLAYISCPAFPHWNAVLCGTEQPVYPTGYYADGDCTVEADGVTYPVAVKSGRIHLSAETVRALCGPVDPSMHIHIPVRTFWRMKCVAIDGVPTDAMPKGYRLNLLPDAKEAKKLMAVSAVAFRAGDFAEIDRIAALFSPIVEMLDCEIAETTADDLSAPESIADAAPATYPASEPEIAPQQAEIAVADDIEGEPDPLAALLARMDELERRLESVSSVSPIAAIADESTLSAQSMPKRTPAHVRAIMAYLAMRQARNVERRHNAIGMTQLDAMRADRDEWEALQHRTWEQSMGFKMKRRRAVLSARVRSKAAWELGRALLVEHQTKNAVAHELATLKQSLADPFNPARESDMILLKGNAAKWQAKAIAAIEESDRLKNLVSRNGGHIENLATRLARAEAILREQGALPVLTLVPPSDMSAAA